MNMLKYFNFLPLLLLIISHCLYAANAKSSLPNDLSDLTASDVQQIKNNQSLSAGDYVKESRNGLLLPGEASARQLLPVSADDSSLPPPFGANLFAGGYESERYSGLNDDYTLAPGDKVAIWLWGAVNLSDTVTVDNQGNLFITNVGPVNVSKIKASQLNKFVTQKIRTIYKKNVEVYVNLLTATPVSIFVTGNVVRPGQYAGLASDSIIYYLKRAGGIDSERGSYRNISIIRKGKLTESIDLYDFLVSGKLPSFTFKDGDVILVDRQGAMLTASGSVKSPFRFETKDHRMLGKSLINYARPQPRTSHVGVQGTRVDGPFSKYMDIATFNNFQLQDGDKVLFNDDQRAQVIDVQIAGSYLGPSYFAVNNRTKLHELLAMVPVDPELSQYDSVYIQRKSVAEKQKKMLNDALDRLERSVLTAPASSTGEAAIRADEAKMVLEFTERARKIEPLGKVIVSDHGKVANIQLEEGDVVVIPAKSNLINIGGEVLMPQAVVYNANAHIKDYIAWSGGYSDKANYERTLVIHQNGSVEITVDGKLEAGDQILVLPRVDSKLMQSVKDITQIIYQIAVAANIALKYS